MCFLKTKNFNGFLIILAIPSYFFIFSVSVAFSVPFFDKETELSMGRGGDKEVIQQFGLYQNKPLQLYVNRIGQKLISNLSNKEFNNYFFKVVDSSDINAFALPGGYIYVTRGLLATLNSEAELAGVLGHEIGHVTLHHAAKHIVRSIGAQILALGGAIASPKNAGDWLLVSTQLFNTINMGYGRDAELESDAHGILTAYESGYDPKGIVAFLGNLRQHEIMSGQAYHSFQATHPDTKDRIVKSGTLAQTVNNREHGKLLENRSNYIKSIRGMTFGGKRHKGDRKQYKEKFIDIYEVKPGDTFTSVAIQELNDETKDLEIAVLNGMKVRNSLTPGQLLKIVRLGNYEKNKTLKLKPEKIK